jgi:hypothetical protein
MTKAEAAAFLGKSERRVAQYMHDGKIRVTYIDSRHGRLATLNREDIERLNREIKSPGTRVGSPASPISNDISGHTADPGSPGSTALARIEPAASSSMAMVAFAEALKGMMQGVAPAAPVAAPKPFMSLAEAVDYSGLPKRLITCLIRAGALPAFRHAGTWFLKRTDLDALKP